MLCAATLGVVVDGALLALHLGFWRFARAEVKFVTSSLNTAREDVVANFVR
jgi:hypothetical protein